MKRFDILFYILLALGIGIGLSQFFAFSARPTYQFWVIAAIVVYYIMWGLLYHYFKKDLEKKLFLEYITLGAIGIVVGVLVFLT